MEPREKNPHAVALGRRRGKVGLPTAENKNADAVALGREGGAAAAAEMTRQQRKDRARAAARARWHKGGKRTTKLRLI